MKKATKPPPKQTAQQKKPGATRQDKGKIMPTKTAKKASTKKSSGQSEGASTPAPVSSIPPLAAFASLQPMTAVGEARDLGDGRIVDAIRWKNPDGSEGGWVAVTASIDPTVYIGPNAIVCYAAKIGPGVELHDGSRVATNAHVYGKSKISGNSLIGAMSFVENSNLHNTQAEICTIVVDSEAVNSTLRTSSITYQSRLDQCLIGRGSHVGGSTLTLCNVAGACFIYNGQRIESGTDPVLVDADSNLTTGRIPAAVVNLIKTPQPLHSTPMPTKPEVLAANQLLQAELQQISLGHKARRKTAAAASTALAARKSRGRGSK